MTATWYGAMIGGAVLAAAAPALAQQTVAAAPSQSLFSRDRNVSVTERQHPEYEPIPLSLGAFTGQPKIDLGVEENDNILAAQTGKKSDAIFTVSPEFDIGSNWSRNALQAYVRSATREYARYSSETSTDWQLGASGRLDAGRGSLTAGGDTGYLTEPRFSINTSHATVHPVRYDQSDAFVAGLEDFNRVRLSARMDFQNIDYDNGVDSTGASVLEKDRSHQTFIYSGKAEYALSPATSVFVDAAYNTHSYSLQPPAAAVDRSAHGVQFDIGGSFDLTRLARGTIEVGYLHQDFQSPVFRPISGLSALGKVEWFPTQLTTVTLTGSRTVQDAGVIGSPAYTSALVGLQADHELLRNLILTAKAGYEDDTFSGLDRHDTAPSVYLAARYMMNRLVSLNLAYNYLNVNSTGAQLGPKYAVNRITVFTTLRF